MVARARTCAAVATAFLALAALSGCGSQSSSGTDSTTASSRPSTGTTTAAQSTAQTSSEATTTSAANQPTDPRRWAESVVGANGYQVVNPDRYSARQRLRYLLGANPARSKMRVFFFLGDRRWLGTDSSEPSARVAVAHSDVNSVQVTYSLYRPSDPDSAPSAGTKTVTFRWNGSRLTPLDAIPSADPSADPSRR